MTFIGQSLLDIGDIATGSVICITQPDQLLSGRNRFGYGDWVVPQ